MATQVNIGEAKTHLSSLLERAAAGEEVIIAKANVPVARLVPIARASGRRTPGRLLGQIVMSAMEQSRPSVQSLSISPASSATKPSQSS